MLFRLFRGRLIGKILQVLLDERPILLGILFSLGLEQRGAFARRQSREPALALRITSRSVGAVFARPIAGATIAFGIRRGLRARLPGVLTIAGRLTLSLHLPLLAGARSLGVHAGLGQRERRLGVRERLGRHARIRLRR